ncbi:MAG: hypothetical protein J6T72_02645, partial [Alphaproteobacteria bacterium]|nr:hypothetical protein [Alphaproteobacteria bacterium]
MSELLKNSTVDTFIRLLDDDKHRWKLIELIPNAETLVEFVTKYKDKQHDIMSALFERGRIDAFKKIIHIYFNKNTEQNKRLRREFITSHAKDVPAKDYHYFFQYFEPEHKQKIAAMLTPDKKTKEKILQFPLVEYTPSEETSKKLEFYNALNKAYTEALPQAAPATKAQKTSYCSQNGIAGYLDENNQYQETYPLIKLVKISEIKKEKEEETEKEETEEQKNFSYTILEAQVPYSPNKHNLAREVFKSIPFPEFWMEDDLKTGKGYFNFLNELDKTYHNAREYDSSFFTLFKNFNINQNTIILDNIVDPTRKTNGLYNGYYSAYTTNQGDIGLVCSFPYDEIDIRHELTHNVGEFENTDIFHFILLLANKQNTISPERYTAIYEPYFIHPNKEFGRESLARIMQFKDFSQSPDPLLSATRNLFTIYADAKSNNQQAIINRIKLCANARVLGYKDFVDAYKYMNNYYLLCKADKQNPKKLETALNNFKKSYLKIVKKHCSKENPNFNSIEKYLIKCIKQEIKAIEQIKNHPLANQIILDVN